MALVDYPLYDGYPIFGEAVLFDGPTPNPTELQISTFPGVNGLFAKNLGSRGFVTTVTGTLVAVYDPDPLSGYPSLAQLEFYLIAYQQAATANVLIDDQGTVYPNVILVSYRRASRTWVDAAGFISVDYEVTFLHLTMPVEYLTGP